MRKNRPADPATEPLEGVGGRRVAKRCLADMRQRATCALIAVALAATVAGCSSDTTDTQATPPDVVLQTPAPGGFDEGQLAPPAADEGFQDEEGQQPQTEGRTVVLNPPVANPGDRVAVSGEGGQHPA